MSSPGEGALGERLDRRVVTVWRLEAVALVLVVAAGAAVALRLATGSPAAGFGAAALLVTVGLPAAWVGPELRWRSWSFAVTDDALELRHGVVVQVHSVVPHFRVQHVAVRRSLLERRLGLAGLTIATASAGTDAGIPGLRPERADAVRRHVLERTVLPGDAV